MIKNIEYDCMGTRYRLVSNNKAGKFNWLFLPGGPGADACYFKKILEHVTLKGSVWLVDFPGNGTNVNETTIEYDFEKWSLCFSNLVMRYEHPILVGHSFGGTYPLLFPELENILSGFVSLSSAPCLWQAEAADLAKKHNVVVSSNDIEIFRKYPSQETFNKALLACIPLHFPQKTQEIGRKLFETLPFNFRAAIWWPQKAKNINFTAKWIPTKVPTLILGGSRDFVNPISLFECDKRFHRKNICLKKIAQAGHFPWVENSAAICSAIENFQFSIEV